MTATASWSAVGTGGDAQKKRRTAWMIVITTEVTWRAKKIVGDRKIRTEPQTKRGAIEGGRATEGETTREVRRTIEGETTLEGRMTDEMSAETATGTAGQC
jgi:hypothetical protein